MRKKIKRSIFRMIVCCFAILLFPPHIVSADAGGELTVGNQKITVTLQKPQEEPEAITSVRFFLTVSVLEGQMQEPSFEFAETVLSIQKPDGVRSAAITGQNGSYLIDIIISEKADQDIFAGGNQAVIGTLNLSPSSGSFRIQTAFTGAPSSDDKQPVLRYINHTGQSVQVVPLSGVRPVVCTDTNGSNHTTIPEIPGYPVTPNVPGNPVTPADPDMPQTPDNPSTTPELPNDTITDNPQTPDETSDFTKKAAPKLTLSAKNKSSKISFAWNRIEGADGYQIYRYEEETKRYTRVKTIANAEKTSYVKTMDYATAYAFRVRAYQTSSEGSRVYGKFSPIAKVTTAPSKVTKLSVRQLKSAKAALTWQPQEGAQGYQIYRSTKKNGTYTRIKTLKNSQSKKYSGISQKRGKTYYYKVRAYVAGEDGVRRYGTFSSVKKLVIR